MKVCLVCGTTHSKEALHCESCGELLGSLKVPSPPTAREDALSSGTLLNNGRYRVLHTVGRGGFAITYRAFDAKHGAYVAIKELFPEGQASRNESGNVIPSAAEQSNWTADIERFEREAEILKSIKHPACVAPVDVWLERGTAYLAMEFLSGETLEARIQRRGTLFESEAHGLLNILLEALVEVHSRGVLHRDLKPANIILIDDYPEIVDFGSARDSDTRKSERILTPAYAPLEQYGQNLKEHPATDLYALAATFYEAVTGYQPESALARAQGRDLTPIRQRNPLIGEQFAQAIEKALSMRLEERFSSANQMREALGMFQVRPSANLEKQQKMGSLFLTWSLLIGSIGFLLWSLLRR